MTVIRLRKEQVIEAIKEESVRSLKAGSWIHVDPAMLSADSVTGDPQTPLYAAVQAVDPACSVCAVGAVLRHVLPGTATAQIVNDVAYVAIYKRDVARVAPSTTDATLEEIMDEAVEVCAHTPLAGLSIIFEGLCDLCPMYDATDMESIRSKCLKFVERYFPETFEVDLGNVWHGPLPGIEVVT